MKLKIGLTYDLRSEYLKEGYSEEETAEFDKEDTIEGIENAIKELGHETERIGNIKQLIRQLSDKTRWDLVFNIAEGMHGIGREAQVPAILEAYQIPYVFSNSLILSITLHKGMTKHIIQNLGLPTPDFKVVATENDLDDINLTFPLFVKPVAEGTGKGISANSKINNKAELAKTCKLILEKFRQPALVETFLPGREFTIGIIGNRNEAKVIGAMEIIFGKEAEENAYSFFNKENYENLVKYEPLREKQIIKQCSDLALKIWRSLDCYDGGRIDLRMDANGIVNFIEINPLAGLRPIHSDLVIIANMNGISYNQLIGMILNASIKRNNL